MTNYMLILAYDGTAFHGFQVQPGLPTVQGALERALTRVAILSSPLYAAGRTDAGVHAKGQVVNFRGTLRVEIERLTRAVNALLPPDISVISAREVEDGFHARKDALARAYSYYFHTGDRPSPFYRRYALHVRGPLDEKGMEEALRSILGVHDFTSFCRREEGRSAVREVCEVELARRGELLRVRVKANAFAWMMMRMLCGSLLEVGRGKWSPQRFREVLAAGDNSLSGSALPPHGLFLERVYYPNGP